jgi:hypothetical protein
MSGHRERNDRTGVTLEKLSGKNNRQRSLSAIVPITENTIVQVTSELALARAARKHLEAEQTGGRLRPNGPESPRRVCGVTLGARGET